METTKTPIKKSTIVRAILLAIVIINFVLGKLGLTPLNIETSVIYEMVESVISVAIIVLGFWKNNSFTENAKKADEYLEKLREIEESN